jgi:fructose-1,6-bisphosphatase/inositol monophosphatase family enzyme
MMTHFDQIPDILRTVAAEKIVPRFQTLADHEISTKSGPNDLVTIADIEAEAELTRILKGLDPACDVVGEEAVSRGEITADLLGGMSDRDIWVIDPVDGTSNFAAGNPRFACMLALVRDGVLLGGWIYDIMGNRMASAIRGQGVSLNGTAISFADRKAPADLADLEGFIARKFLPPAIRPDIDARLGDIRSYKTYASAAHDYLALLEGERDFSIYTRIKPWDHLAGSLMMHEAGGVTRKWDASPYHPADERGGLINTADPDLWPRLHQHFILPIEGKVRAWIE